MRTDIELQKMLVKKTANYCDTVPVFKIRNQSIDQLHQEAVRLALPHTNATNTSRLRFDGVKKENHTLLRLQDNATIQYYPASGFKCFQKNTPEYLKVVSDHADQVDRKVMEDVACDLLEKNGLNLSGPMESVHFEKLFQLKSAGMSQDRKVTPTVINRLVYAYRRFVNDLPVLGSASVYIKTAAESELEAFGLDWRYFHEDPLTRATIISPDDAARQALEQLQNTNPERVYTAASIEPLSFELGYFSHSKSMYQTVLQPVYIARFIFKGTYRMGYVIAVPAAGTPYESICRKVAPPPFNPMRKEVKNRDEKLHQCNPYSHK